MNNGHWHALEPRKDKQMKQLNNEKSMTIKYFFFEVISISYNRMYEHEPKV